MTMKAEELMIGDLVQYTSDQWLTNEDALPLKVTCVGEPKYPDFYPYIRIEGRNENYHIDLFQPIPLTPEILEKNGFKKNHDAVENVNTFISNYFQFFLIREEGKWWLSIYDSAPSILNLIGIEYVHELQHALRLCGIIKNIVL